MSTVYSVFQINNYIKNMFRQDFLLSGNVQVQGEVSNCKDHSTGLYFTLKDEKAAISCVMFRSASAGLAFSLRPGDQVVVTGNIDLYAKTGACQLYVKKIEKSGAGVLYERFLKLKEKLEDMGMFSDVYKQSIPSFAQKVGVVTAPTGAVIRDILNVAKRRHPGVSIYLYPSLVQGENAAESIAKGISVLDKMGLDVMIVGRGGGSIEDLWAFNEEIVARAIFDADTPIISAVGHETDWTIADFTADLRAPTPSAAAELAVPDVTALLNGLDERENYFGILMNNTLSSYKNSLNQYSSSVAAHSPGMVIKHFRDKTVNYKTTLISAFDHYMNESRYSLSIRTEKLQGLSPLEKLKQGFSFVSVKDGRPLQSINDIRPGDSVSIDVKDGEIDAQVYAVKERNIGN